MIKHIIENIKRYGPIEWSIVAAILVVLVTLLNAFAAGCVFTTLLYAL